MPLLYIIAASFLFFVSGASNVKVSEPVYLKCYGYSPCSACTTCNYCAHCNSGGTCGVCKDLKSNNPKSGNKPVYLKQPTTAKPNNSSPAVASSQCKAITKKGTRCSRNSRSGGYCWQHGG